MESPLPLQPFPTPPSGPQPLPTRPGFTPRPQRYTATTMFRGE